MKKTYKKVKGKTSKTTLARPVAQSVQRVHLDAFMKRLKPYAHTRRPRQGWVRIIRDSLSMSVEQLAARLNVTRARVGQIERAELAGSLSIRTLDRVAKAMQCRVYYTLVPDTSLYQTVMDRAAQIADQRMIESHALMKSEYNLRINKGLHKALRQTEIDDLLAHPALLWCDFDARV